MLIQNKRYDNSMLSLHYLIQSSWAKQGDNSLHKENLPVDNHSYINVSGQVKPIKERAIGGAWIIH